MSSPLQTDDTGLHRLLKDPFRKWAEQCWHCGYCLEVCPTYDLFGTETDSPRGRIYMLQAVVDGRLDQNAFITEVGPHLDLCLGCLACEAACVSDVRYGRLLVEARLQLDEIQPAGVSDRALRWLVFRNALPKLSLLKLAAGFLWIYQNCGMQSLVRRLSILPRRLRTAENLLPKISLAYPRFDKPALAHGEKVGQVALFIGCLQDALLVNINQAAVRVLQRNGFEVIFPNKQTCCGALHLHSGDEVNALQLARRNIDAFLETDCNVILNTAGGCGLSLKEYALWMENDPAYAEKAVIFTSKIQDFSEFLVKHLTKDFKAINPITAAYIDSCHLRHGQRIIEQPRTLLKAIPGLEIIDLPNPDRCCGSAGTYNLSEIEPADAILSEKLADIAASGVEIVITSNTGCHLQLLAGSRRSRLPVRILHIAEVLDLAYRGELKNRDKARASKKSFSNLAAFKNRLAWLQDRGLRSAGVPALRSLLAELPRGQVIDNPAALLTYERDAGEEHAIPGGVVIPENAKNIQKLLSWATENQTPIVARGAGTGFCGGAVARREGVIVHFSQMKSIREFDPWSRSVIVQPGVVNQQLTDFVQARGFYYPPDPASASVSTIGGNIGTNAGGLHCFKYGVTSNYVRALDIVLVDGSLRKLGGGALDSPEYDLRGLVTGSESTLAIIVEAEMGLRVAPPITQTMMATFDKLETAGNGVSAIIAAGWIPSVLEIMDRNYMRIAETYLKAGLPVDAAATLIIEVDGYQQGVANEVEGIRDVLSAVGASSIRIAQSQAEAEEIWCARTQGSSGIALIAESWVALDVTVPRIRLSECLAGFMHIAEDLDLPNAHLAHAGDGNMHPHFLIIDASDAIQVERANQAYHRAMELVIQLNGSIAGEHGIGSIKREYMPRMYSNEELSAMLDIKHIFDPSGLLNPNKIFPNEVSVVKLPPVRNTPNPVQYPISTEEAANVIRAWGAAGRKFDISGAGPQPEYASDGTSLISTAKMRGIRELVLEDQLVFVRSGTPLSELNLELARHRMMVPMASPWMEATIGGLVSSNANAPLRMRYGAIKDNLLSLTTILPDGRMIQAGRPVRKNVAGYDLTGVFVGAYGTLGLITELCLKLVQVPESCETFVVSIQNHFDAIRWGGAILENTLFTSSLLLCAGITLPGIYPGLCLIYTFEGTKEQVQAERDKMNAMLMVASAPQPVLLSANGTRIWADWLEARSREHCVLRTAIPPRQLQDWVVEKLEGVIGGKPFILDLAHGMLYTDGVENLQSLRVAAAGGYAIVMGGNQRPTAELDPWGFQPANLDLMLSLKNRWDPKGLSNHGRFVI